MTPQERIEARIIGPMADDVCWETNYGCRGGYPTMSNMGASVLVHRLAWEIHNCEPIPEGKVVRHTCDNPLCCNPAHLILGTQGDNNRDTVSRNRHNPNALGCYLTPNGRYMAMIWIDNKNEYLGTYDTFEEARAVYLAKREELHGNLKLS